MKKYILYLLLIIPVCLWGQIIIGPIEPEGPMLPPTQFIQLNGVDIITKSFTQNSTTDYIEPNGNNAIYLMVGLKGKITISILSLSGVNTEEAHVALFLGGNGGLLQLSPERAGEYQVSEGSYLMRLCIGPGPIDLGGGLIKRSSIITGPDFKSVTASVRIEFQPTPKQVYPISPSRNHAYIMTVVPQGEVSEYTSDLESIQFSDISGNQTDPRVPHLETGEPVLYLDDIPLLGPPAEKINPLITIQYFDGLGRPAQTVQKGITPNAKDLVSLQEYDSFGRESNAWLPAAIAGNNGAYVNPTTVISAARTINQDQNPFSKPVYESSPLNRVLEQYGPGQDWQSSTNKKAQRMAHMTNTSSAPLNCLIYTAEGTNQVPTLKKGSYYATGQLYVTEIKDEDDNISYEFKDKLGQVILIRQMDGTTRHDTYYVYNDFGNLCYVLPPRIDDEGITTAKLNELAYQYRYDNQDRCIWKKLPGCEPIYYVYDKADRLIFTQDGEQRTKGEWTFSIPDAFGRVVLAGTCKNNLTYTADPLGSIVVKGTWAKATNTYKGYTITGVSLSTPTVLSANYYDNYDFLSLNGIPNNTNTQYTVESGYGTCYGDHQAANKHKSKGLLTGTMIAQMNTDGTLSSTYLYSVMYYDNRGRLIQTKSNNHLAGGIEKEYIAYNFTGQPTKRMHVHSATGKTTQTEIYTYEYDHAGRLLKTKHKLNSGAEIVLAQNTYDELGRLKTNQKHTHANLKTTYAYNIRSWTKSITSPLFSQTLYYNDKVTAHTYSDYKQQYNGNISGMEWQLQGESKRSYRFKYDKLSRLLHTGYSGSTSGGMYNVSYSYDKHGNMKTLTRRGKNSSATDNNVTIDQLTMTYAGNQLTRVEDAAADISYALSDDFKDKKTTTGTIEYTYNKNGAMASDLNKGITDIEYNSLNLPRQMIINSSTTKAKNYYTYSASGVKLKTEQRYDPNLLASPITGTSPTNDGLVDYKNTDYAGNIIYETAKSGTAITNKTRILVDGGYIEDGVYHFYLTDHLGNNRVVAKADGTVIQKSHYYPFGMAFAEGAVSEQGKQPYKYNGKELDTMHGLNMYDYSARYYEPAVGRFTTVDPLAEKFYSWSLYVYTFNNPLRFTDPTGMEPNDGILGFLSSLGNKIEKFFLGNTSNPPSNLQGADKAIYQLQEIEQGGARAQSASNYIEAVNEGMQAVHPMGSTIGAVAKGATGQEVTAGDVGYVALELPVIGTVGKVAKVAKTVDKVADAAKVVDKTEDVSRAVSKSKTTTTVGDKFSKTTKTVPGKGGGQSRAEYVVIKNQDGKTIRTYKDSYDRANTFRHRKPLRGGPEGRPQ